MYSNVSSIDPRDPAHYFKPNILDSADIDLSAYLDIQEKNMVRPASDFVKDLIEAFYGDKEKMGLSLPWSKAQNLIKLRPGELSLWTGHKGHGKSLFLSQIILHAMTRDERALILSLEFNPTDVLKRKVTQAAATRDPAIPYIKAWCEWARSRLWLYNCRGNQKWTSVLAILRYALDKFGISHVVVDSLMKCGIAPGDYDTQKRFMDGLNNFSHDTGCHVHLVAHSRKGVDDSKMAELYDVKGTSELVDMAENVFSVWKNKKKINDASAGGAKYVDEPDAVFLCDSQRNGDWTGKFNLWFHTASGQYVESANARPKVYWEMEGAADYVH